MCTGEVGKLQFPSALGNQSIIEQHVVTRTIYTQPRSPEERFLTSLANLSKRVNTTRWRFGDMEKVLSASHN